MYLLRNMDAHQIQMQSETVRENQHWYAWRQVVFKKKVLNCRNQNPFSQLRASKRIPSLRLSFTYCVARGLFTWGKFNQHSNAQGSLEENLKGIAQMPLQTLDLLLELLLLLLAPTHVVPKLAIMAAVTSTTPSATLWAFWQLSSMHH